MVELKANKLKQIRKVKTRKLFSFLDEEMEAGSE